jgi:CRISPR-associated protein Csm4
MYSDTLFGHLCWQMFYREGQQALADFLARFFTEQPPFVVSDGFPAGLLPRPLLPQPAGASADLDHYHARKKWQKFPFLRTPDFLRWCQDPSAEVEAQPDPWRTVQIPHAAIDRRIDTTGSEEFAGRFYQTEVCHMGSSSTVEVYARVLPGELERLLDLLKVLGQVGFGRDKSLGFGQFRVSACTAWTGFVPFPGANAVVSLSTLMPKQGDPTEGWWQLRIKHGFLGEQASAKPFKRPLVQLEPGAVFRIVNGHVPPFLGRMVPGIAPGMPQAVQCGLALTAACRWSPEA